MLMVAEDKGFASYRRMKPKRAFAPPSAEIAAYGEALRVLRDSKGLSQERAAKAIGQTKQSWQAYEAGERQNILRRDLQRRLCEALDVDIENLHELAAQILETGSAPIPDQSGFAQSEVEKRLKPATETSTARDVVVPIYGMAKAGAANVQVFDDPVPESFIATRDFLNSSTRLTRAGGDLMSGYVESGGIVAWEPGRWPQRGRGCVAVLAGSGEVLIRIYEGQDGEDILLGELYPTPRTTRVPMSAISKLGAVKWREG